MLEIIKAQPVFFIAIINAFLFLLIFIIMIRTNIRLKKLRAKYNRFMNGNADADMSIEELLEDCIEGINNVNNKNMEIENHINTIERNLMTCIQKVGVVRFNAFDNVGSDLSFSIALLDSNDSGVVLSGLYSRDSSSTYAKPVAAGKSKYPLSAEELKAIDIAKKVHWEKPYLDKMVK